MGIDSRLSEKKMDFLLVIFFGVITPCFGGVLTIDGAKPAEIEPCDGGACSEYAVDNSVNVTAKPTDRSEPGNAAQLKSASFHEEAKEHVHEGRNKRGCTKWWGGCKKESDCCEHLECYKGLFRQYCRWDGWRLGG